MSSHRIGNGFLIIAAIWLAALAFIGPGATASGLARSIMIHAAVAMVAILLIPAHQYLTITVFSFSVLGISLSVMLLGMFGIGLPGLIPPVLFVISMWLRRNLLDGSVIVWALVYFSIGLWAPAPAIFGWYLVAIVNAVIWLYRRLPDFRSRQDSTSGT